MKIDSDSVWVGLEKDFDLGGSAGTVDDGTGEWFDVGVLFVWSGVQEADLRIGNTSGALINFAVLTDCSLLAFWKDISVGPSSWAA